MVHDYLCLHKGTIGDTADAAAGHSTVCLITASGERLQPSCSLYALLCGPQARWALVPVVT